MLNIIVKIIHLLFVLFVLVAPFSTNRKILDFYIVLIPFLFLHWITNNDTCAFTELEKFLTNKQKNEDTFIGSIVSPIFKITNRDYYLITIVLFLIALNNLLQVPWNYLKVR